MKKIFMRIKTLALLVVLMAGLIFSQPVEVQAYNNEVSNGVVVVTWYLLDAYYFITDGTKVQVVKEIGDTVGSSGTGFFIGDTDENPENIVTNYHVINTFVEKGEGEASYIATGQTYQGYALYVGFESSQIRIYYSENEYEEAFVVTHGEIDRVDLAVLKLRTPTDKRQALALSIPDEDIVGDTVYAVGFPGLGENVFSGASKWSVNDVTVTKGTVNRMVATAGTGVERIQMDAIIQHGNSGGPLVNESGYVVGINTNSYGEDELNYYAINVEELITMLDSNGIEYEVGNSAGDLLIALIIVVAIIVVIIVIVVVVVLALTRSKKKKNQSANQQANMQSMGMQQPNMQPNMQPAGVQQMNMGSTSKTVGVQHVAAMSKIPMVRSMSAQHNGMCVNIGSTPVLVGRDASTCSISYQENTPGVSGRHCTIDWKKDSAEFIITDLGSTYGTYLMNGQRLQPNVPYRLKAGESFCVGDKANVLRVEVN